MPVGAEHLDPAQAWSGEVVVPDAGQRAERTVRETQCRRGHVFDPVMAMEVGRVRTDVTDLPDEESQHVDVVNAVLEQRARPGQVAVAAPRGAVMALNGDELVVSEDDSHHRAGRMVVDEMLR